MQIIKKFKHTFPICYVDGNKVLIYNKGEMKLIHLDNLTISSKFKIKNTKSKFILNIPFYERFFRDYPRCGFYIGNDQVLIYLHSHLTEYNCMTGQCTGDYQLPNGIRPLKFYEIKDVDGFEDGIYFGEYLDNFQRKPVGIYRRISSGNWIRIPLFREGEINHIHSVIPDKESKCVWVFTGDFESSAGIWKAENNFQSITPVLIGSQEYRGCIGFPTAKGLVYATDSQFISNSIKILNYSGYKYNTKVLKKINGSCIYGCEINGLMIFESSVEGSGIYRNKIEFLFDRKRGKGIKENKVCMYAGNIDNDFNEILSLKKDSLPFSFQFGSILFPSGINTTNRLVMTPIATSIHDQTTLIIELDNK